MRALSDQVDTRDVTETRRDTYERNALLADRYRVQRRLGSGGSGVVYEAHDEARASAGVALKLLVSQAPGALIRLKNEFRALSMTVHPNLVGLHGLGVDRRGWFVVMDLIDPSQDFVEYVRSGGYCEARLRSALVQLLRGVAALHAAGKLHRDLKPNNVLVTERGRLVIVDFGLLAEANDGEGHFVGTPAYAAPEQMCANAVGASADMYAVGVMLYEALTARLPVDGPNNEELVRRKLYEPIALPTGVAPDLAALCMALLAPDPRQRPSTHDALQQLGEAPIVHDTTRGPAKAPFVARADELASLHAALARSQAHGAQVALVLGPSGIGKTSLSLQFAARARARAGALVFSGRCHPLEQVPYKAFDTLIDSLAGYLAKLPAVEAAGLMPRNVALLARLFPTLASVPMVMGMPDDRRERDPALLRARAFAALKELLGRIADRRPLLLTLDDLQWSDLDSMELLRELVSGSDTPACLFLCTLRSDHPRPRLLEQTLERADTVSLQLGPLSGRDSLTLARTLLGADADPLLIEEAEGNPLLIEQLARAARGATRGLAETVRALLRDEPARALIELVCVAGHPLAVELAVRAVPLEPDTLRRVLACWLLTARVQHGEDHLEPRHDRLRELVLETLPPTRLCELHASLAYALIRARTPDPEQIAQHFDAAGLYEEAAPYLAQAAARAMEAFAFGRAEALYRQALSHASAGFDALELSLARAQTNLGKIGEAADRLERLLQRSDDPEQRRELCSEAMMLHLLAGHIEPGVRLLDVACRELEQPSVPRSGARALLSVAGLLVRHLVGPRIASLPVPTHAEHHGNSRQALALCLRATRGFVGLSGTYSEYFALRSLLAIRRHRDPTYWPIGIAWEVLRRSIFSGVVAPGDEPAMSRAFALAEKHGDPEITSLVWAAEGARCYMIGKSAACAHAFSESERVLREHGRSVVPVHNGSRSGQLAAWLTMGDIERVRSVIPAWTSETAALGDRFGQLVVHVMGSYTMLAAGDARGMRAATAVLDEPFAQQTLFPCDPWWQGDPALYEGDGELAWKEFQRARAQRFFHAVERSPAHRTSSALFAGRARLLLATRRDRAHQLHAVAAIARAMANERHVLGAPIAAHLHAGIAIQRDDPGTALRELERAEAGYDALDVGLQAAAMRFYAGMLRGGEDGRARQREANATATRLGIRQPERWFAMVLPGFSH